MLADNFILSLDSVELDSKDLLPECSGIYYVVDLDSTIWYIGRSVNLKQRWNGEKIHHRYHQLLTIASNNRTAFSIYYLEKPKQKLNLLEKIQIEKYQPLLNNTSVANHISVVAKGFSSSEKQSYSFVNNTKNNQASNISNKKYNLTILSTDEDRKNTMTTCNKNERIDKTQADIRQFKRKFITLKDDEIGLTLQLEICYDSQDRLFVRHYTLYIFYGGTIEPIEDKEENERQKWLAYIDAKRKLLYEFSIKWLGYQLKCQDIVLIDEEENLEIETLAIMLPFNLFVDLVEYMWLKDRSMAQTLEKQEKNWYKNQRNSYKIAKWLHERNLNLHKLAKNIEQYS